MSSLLWSERRERTYHCRYKELKNEDEDEGFLLSVVLVRFGAFVVFLTLLLLFKRERQTTEEEEEDGERTLLRLRRVRGSVLLETLDFRLMVHTNLRRHGEELVALEIQQTSIF